MRAVFTYAVSVPEIGFDSKQATKGPVEEPGNGDRIVHVHVTIMYEQGIELP